MQLPRVIETLEAYGMVPLVHHVGEPGQPVSGVVKVDHQIIPVNDGKVRDDDLLDFMEEQEGHANEKR